MPVEEITVYKSLPKVGGHKSSSAVNTIFAVIFIFLCRYNFQLSFLPFTMLEIVQAIGIIYVVLLFFDNKLHIYKKISGVFLFSLVTAVVSIISATRDFFGSLQFIRTTLDIFFFYGICLLTVKNVYHVRRDTGIAMLFDIWIYSSVIQILITVIFFIDNTIYDTVYSFLKVDSGIESRRDALSVRMMGLGNQFFGAGFNYSIDMLVMALLPYVEGSKIYRNKLLYWLICAMILVVGLLSARVFIVGVACTILFLFINERKKISGFIKGSFRIIIWGAILLFIAFYLLSKYVPTFDLVFEWAFEIFINMFSGEGVRSNSTDVLLDMYVFPQEVSTWLIGDGRITTSDGSYYMHTDVGFIRMIFFFGLPMTIIYYYYQLYMARKIYTGSSIHVLKPFLLCYVLMVYLFNLKGLISGSYFLILLLTYYEYSVTRYQRQLTNRKH